MANPEQLDLLKTGVEGWNKWREEHPKTKIDLTQANLSGTNLTGANLSEADLWLTDLREAKIREANLEKADLREANLSKADLSRAHLNEAYLTRSLLDQALLYEADLTDADLSGANLWLADLTRAELFGTYFNGANLKEADLYSANLKGANLREANLAEAELTDADLSDADLSHAYLRQANLSGARIGSTSFVDTDLSETVGLETTRHSYPSTIGTDTLQLSKGKLPEAFLRGCGFADWEIESAKLHDPDLTNEEIVKIQYRIYDIRATQAIQISPLFISYSHADTAFVNQIDSALTSKGVRFWRDTHNAKAGRLETQIDRAIRQNPTVLLVLSMNSLKSDWVQHEVRKARELEKELGHDALCPIALDDNWKSSSWPAHIMEQVMEYNILDFSGWESDSAFESTFAKLLSGLDLFYNKPTK